MLQPSNRGSGLRPTKVIKYGAGALVVVLIASVALHAVLGLLSFVFEIAVVVGVVGLVLHFFGFGRRRR